MSKKTHEQLAQEIADNILDLNSADGEFLICPSCKLFTDEPIRDCKKCSKKCCKNCQSIDGSDCIECGVSPEWRAHFGKRI
jgi:tRNA A37 threonylcarbamoyladenosine synthetase subunit TsaC/SUA5/YrdC